MLWGPISLSLQQELLTKLPKSQKFCALNKSKRNLCNNRSCWQSHHNPKNFVLWTNPNAISATTGVADKVTTIPKNLCFEQIQMQQMRMWSNLRESILESSKSTVQKTLCALKSFQFQGNNKALCGYLILSVTDCSGSLKCSESKNFRFFLLGKQAESERIASSSYIWNIKEPAVFMKEPTSG
jgi:hypothetical protein